MRCIPFLVIKGGWPGGEVESAAALSLIAAHRRGRLFKEKVKLISKLYLTLRGVVSGESNALFDTSGTYVYKAWMGSPERVLEAETFLSKPSVDVYSMSSVLNKALKVVKESVRSISCLGMLPIECWRWIAEERLLEADSPIGILIPEGLPYEAARLNLEKFSDKVKKLGEEIPFLRGALAALHSVKVTWNSRIDDELESLSRLYGRKQDKKVKAKMDALEREKVKMNHLFEELFITIEGMIKAREKLFQDVKQGVTEFTVVRIPFYIAVFESGGHERFVVVPPVRVYTRDEILELERKPNVMLTYRHEFCRSLGEIIHRELSGRGALKTWIRLNIDKIELRNEKIREMVMEGMETLRRLGIVDKDVEGPTYSLFR